MAATTIHQNVRQMLDRTLSQEGPDAAVLQSALRLLAKYRSTLIQNTLVARHGTKVHAGPFAGMDFVERSTEGCHVPKLLGCYEEELHGVIEEIGSRQYDCLLNIGSAEGYYAVGLKRLLADTRVCAFDIDENAQQACRSLAAKNGVSVDVGGEFTPANFADFPGRVLVWCDIEGAEIELLDPVKAPALMHMDMVVELHQSRSGHARDVVPQRFAETHEVEIISARGHNPELPDFLHDSGHLDQLLAQWEWRSEPTPWAVLRVKNNNS